MSDLRGGSKEEDIITCRQAFGDVLGQPEWHIGGVKGYKVLILNYIKCNFL